MSEPSSTDLKIQAVEAIGKILVALHTEQIDKLKEALKWQVFGMAELARKLGVLEARLTYSLEGHAEQVYLGREEPQLQPTSSTDW